MPIELLLLIAFILLPLIQQLLRAVAERRAQGEPEQPPAPRPRGSRPGASGPALPSHVARSPAPAVPAMPSVPSMAVPPRAASRGTLGAAAMPTSSDRWRVRRRGTVGRFKDPYTLHDAIVVMTILGPCRAVAGDDGGASFYR